MVIYHDSTGIKNQYQSTIIEICCVENEPALMTALDTALIQHWYQQITSIDTSRMDEHR